MEKNSLGGGITGSVYLAKDKRTQEHVAIKQIKKASLSENQLVRIRREYAISPRFQHRGGINAMHQVRDHEEAVSPQLGAIVGRI